MADVLVVDDQDRVADLCRRTMPEHRWRGPARSWKEAADWLSRGRGRIDLVLLDVNFDIPAEDLVGIEAGASPREVDAARRRQGLEILRVLRERYPDLPVILMTSREEQALEAPAEALRAEEYTYFLEVDTVDARSLRAQIESVSSARRGQESDGPVFWGHSFAMRRQRQRLEVLSRGRLPVVLLGPTGTGKSLVARHFVHPRSGRSGAFVAIDLATLPRDLMAAHLFGSVKGAYTGSVADRTGAFEAAHGGTLFLDEIGNLPPDAQKMLLSVLQEGTITRLGDVKERPVDVKLVVATNEDLAARVREGTFRADLYMRLNPATAVTLPPLADRAIDIERLLAFCLDQAVGRPFLKGLLDAYRREHKVDGKGVVVHTGASLPDPVAGTLVFLWPERALRHLRRHPWPGNLREFAMVVENAVTFAVSELVGVAGGERSDVIQVRPKLVRDLLSSSGGLEDADGEGWPVALRVRAHDTLNKVALDIERQYFETLWVQEAGDFAAMARILLGDEAHARKVQLRFNQMGLKVRELKEQLS